MLLPFERPYHAAWVATFLAGRAIPGIESLHGLRYRRRLPDDAWVEAELTLEGLRVNLPTTGVDARDARQRLRRLFDLGAPATVIDARLIEHPDLKDRIRRCRGVRVPGFWDPFEGAVRAILGQQVSVSRATVLAATLCERFGGGSFPSAEVLACADVAAIGMPGKRGRAVSNVAERVADEGDTWLTKPDTLRSGFADVPGVGPWTTEYTAMRVARDPDAFPDTDWGVFKALGCKGRAAREWAEPCRPWRAYATMVLWTTGRDE